VLCFPAVYEDRPLSFTFPAFGEIAEGKRAALFKQPASDAARQPEGNNRGCGASQTGDKMAKRPIGKLDHIGIAVRSVADARKFFEDALGARFLYEHANPDAGYRILEFDLSGLTLELLEPLGEESFLHSFLDKHGEGFHHLTLDVPNAREQIEELKQQGVTVVSERDFGPDSYEAFISPRSSHGVLIQLGSGYPTLARAAEWFSKKQQ
jgi:methylmalonyl-CoA/ethylmalonyl-CoA epimerase